jgi:hypothetical protein
MAALIVRSGDVEQNPGPPKQSTKHQTTSTNPHTTSSQTKQQQNQDKQQTIWICSLCNKKILNHQPSLQCTHKSHHWVHKTCGKISLPDRRKDTNWKCSIHHKQTLPTQPADGTNQPYKKARKTRPKLTQTSQTTNLDNNNNNDTTKLNPRTKKEQNSSQINILQVNINGISNKILELQQLTKEQNIDIITIQETKLKLANKLPSIPSFTAVRQDRNDKEGGGLLTFIKNDITFSELKNKNPNKFIESQTIEIHVPKQKPLHITNLYIPPRSQTNNAKSEDTDIESFFTEKLALPNSIISGDVNAHSSLWHSPIQDHRGATIENLIQNSEHIILNSNTPTRLSSNKDQQPTSPDITTISNNLHPQATWKTINQLASDHLPIIITLQAKNTIHRHHKLKSYSNYKKANWEKFSEEIELKIAKQNTPKNIHHANKTLVNAIIEADKHNIPKGKIQTKHSPLPQDIRTKITERNETRKQDPKNPIIQTLNNEINKQIQIHKTNLWKTKLEKTWDHKTDTHTFWNTLNSLQGKTKPHETNRTITFNNKTKTTAKQIATSFNQQFTNPSKYTTHKENRKINRQVNKLPLDSLFFFTEEQVQRSIKTSKNNNSTGPDNINIQHLKHLGPIAIKYLTDIYNLSIQQNKIPDSWKIAKIIPIPKPNKDLNQGTSYRPISLLSPISKCFERLILNEIQEYLPKENHQHGFKKQHSTITLLNKLTDKIATGFNKKQPPERTVVVSLDMSKAFDTVNTHKLINKILHTNIPANFIKIIANYLKGRKAYTLFNGKTSIKQALKMGVPQGGVLSPALFNIYTSDIPDPPSETNLHSFADDINTFSSHINTQTAQNNLQPYLNTLFEWTKENELTLNPDKSSSTLFTPDPAEYSTKLNLQINNITIPTVTNPKILGVTFDPKLNFGTHVKNTIDKAKKSLNILKALTTRQWGKNKETLITTYNTITRPIIEYGGPVWSPLISTTNLNNLQTIQNSALRIATGCTADTNITHLHQETLELPLKEHLFLHANQLKTKALLPDHPLNNLHQHPTPPRKQKLTLFQNETYNLHKKITTTPNKENINQAILNNHTQIVAKYLNDITPNAISQNTKLTIHTSEQNLPRQTRVTLAQLRANKSPFLLEYLHKINPTKYPSSQCPLCKSQIHDTFHLFNCPIIPTPLTTQDLWNQPEEAARLLSTWKEKIGPI